MKKISKYKPKALSFRDIIIVSFLILILLATGFIIPFLLTERLAGQLRQQALGLVVGEIADRNVIAQAQIQYIDYESTEEARQIAVQNVKPIFTLLLDRTLENLSWFHELKIYLLENSNEEIPEFFLNIFSESEIDIHVIKNFYNSLNMQEQIRLLHIAEEKLKSLYENGVFAEEELQKAEISSTSDILIKIFNDEYIEETVFAEKIDSLFIYSKLHEELAVWSLSGLDDEIILRKTAVELIKPFLEPNMLYDNLGTLQAVITAKASVEPIIGTIEKGEYIIVKDYIVTQEAIEKLKGLQRNELDQSLGIKIGNILYSTAATIIMLIILVHFLPSNYRFKQFLYITLSGIIIYFILFTGITGILFTRNFPSFVYFIPIAFFTMLLTVVAGKKTGYLVSSYLALLALIIPQGDYRSFIFLLALGITGTVIITRARKRIDMIKSFMYLASSGLLLLLIIGLLGDYSLTDFYTYSIIVVANALVSSILFVMLLPVVENIFNLPTDFRLLELTTMNTRVLKRMAVVARGTYSHSVSVADLAESACEAIGANSLLARVGAYYHDIGKTDQPEYFIENQTGDNKHDELKPSLSAAVIKSHVKVGIEKAKEIGLPQEVIDILAQHHGSDLISYFYIEAMNKSDKNSKISPEDFSYNGKLPVTREAAVVMLADSVEAASRTIKQPTTPKLEKLVWKIIMDKINNKQLTNCNLSLSELEEIKKRFILILSGRYHTRIEYPDLPEGKKG
ncbi:MAG: HDIG domain-containing protein [Spirochaetales bacterium]|nr:HDIG domain-containing protein [Spirochaetales bacterium]